MKAKKYLDELRALDLEQLLQKYAQNRRDYFTLRLNAQTAHVKNYAQFSTLKRDIARILTVVREKQK